MATISELEDLENAGYDGVHDWVWNVCNRQVNGMTAHNMALDWMIDILKEMDDKTLIEVLAEYVIEQEDMNFDEIERCS